MWLLTWIISGFSKHRTTWRITLTWRIVERNWFPRPSPLWAPLINPATSMNCISSYTVRSDWQMEANLSNFASGIETIGSEGEAADDFNKDIGFIGIDCAKGVIRHSCQLWFCQSVKKCRFPDIGQSHNSNRAVHSAEAGQCRGYLLAKTRQLMEHGMGRWMWQMQQQKNEIDLDTLPFQTNRQKQRKTGTLKL